MAPAKANSQRLASWIFGGIACLLLIGVFIFGPDELSPDKHRVLGIMSAVLAGLFGYFFTGSIKLIAESEWRKWAKVSIQAGGGTALFVFVLLWWGSDYPPVGRLEEKIDDVRSDTSEMKENTSEIKQSVGQIVEMLRGELSVKNEQVEFLQGEVNRLREINPSDRARQLAQQIPEDAGPYALALKAIAAKRFDDARRFLDKAQKQKETELAEIYRTRGQTELYAGNYKGAAEWYEKALALAPDNLEICRETGVALLFNARYEQAELLLRKSLEIAEASFGPNDPNISRDLSNLAVLLYETNRANQAESLIRRALTIDETNLGKDHPTVAVRLTNLAWLLKRTGRLGEAETALRRALDIYEKAFSKDDAMAAITLNNLGVLLRDTNRLVEAEPFMRRGLEIDEKALGKDHPLVAAELSDLAGLLAATNRHDQAEPLMRRAIVIDEKSFGNDHPNVAIRLNNLAVLLQNAKRLVEAEPLMRRALAIDEKCFGKDHPRVAAELNDLAGLLVATDRSGEAEPLYRRALGIFEASLGPDDPKTQTVRSNLDALK